MTASNFETNAALWLASGPVPIGSAHCRNRFDATFMGEVTLLIERARQGDRQAFDRIFELLYPELRQIAHRRLARSGRGGIAETTALVNECFMKFVQRDSLKPADRAHFLAYSATIMRSIIVDAARQAGTHRRGSDAEHVTLSTDVVESTPAAASEILEVHAALDDLERMDAPRTGRQDALFR